MELFNFQFDLFINDLIKLVIAFLLPMPVAFHQEKIGAAAGLLTFSLVSVAACGFALVAMSNSSSPEVQARVVTGIITGIGFIGGGAILKGDGNVNGISSAAAIWVTGAIGLSVALNRLDVALALSLMTYLIFIVVGNIKKKF